MMTKKDFPFQKVWFGVDLGDIRPINATYGGEYYDLLPPVPSEFLDGNFQYLNNEDIKELESNIAEHIDITFQSTQSQDIFQPDSALVDTLLQIQSSLPERIKIPDALFKFMSAPEAQNLVPSCTACYFDLPDEATPFKWLGEDAYLFHFYRDQQDCLFWYYYVRTSGESCILSSPIPFFEEETLAELDDSVIKEELFYVADNFEEFIYRTWIENVLWFSTHDDMEGSEQTKNLINDYINHYKKKE